jgi:hypothetical protein
VWFLADRFDFAPIGRSLRPAAVPWCNDNNIVAKVIVSRPNDGVNNILGASNRDGVARAWAVTEYRHDALGCWALDATPYHELALPGLPHKCCLERGSTSGTLRTPVPSTAVCRPDERCRRLDNKRE